MVYLMIEEGKAKKAIKRINFINEFNAYSSPKGVISQEITRAGE